MERLPPGGVVGRYELVARLGEGAMGIVYLGRSRGGDLVAVKVMKDLWVADPDYRARFRREIGAARRVTGLYTAAPLDFDADASPPWLATRYLPGLSLRDAVRRHGAGLPPPALRALATGLAEALSAIHAAGVVHRDLKPENVLLTADGPRVIDFGIARPDDATFLTVPGGSRFTREYSAPEQAAGGPVDAAGDVFALGAVVLFAAGARDPFGSGPPRSAPDLSAVTDPALRRVVGACLRWEPRRRPSARQVLDRLGTGTPPLAGSRWLPDGVADEIDRRASYALDLPSLPSLPTPGATPASALGAETLPPPPVLPVPAVRPGPRRRTLVVGAAGLGVLAVAGTVVGTRWRRGTATPGAGPVASPPTTPSPTTPPVAT
ncbi:MAG TPA: serine/threonine-protein kinase, partial [Actinocatenispora sp.]